ncbi:hypothetical protein PMAG_a3677 [Pseudoalteromonas mariniglutinosa NCIMB 1770]|nr:hypothetical protein [Pseudoalteromonas mariniglutinosa NCIMB 1770]
MSSAKPNEKYHISLHQKTALSNVFTPSVYLFKWLTANKKPLLFT